MSASGIAFWKMAKVWFRFELGFGLFRISSCILKPFSRIISSSSGSYFLDGTETSKASSDEFAWVRNEKIGFVFQGFNLLSRTTALQNVELPLFYGRAASRKEISGSSRRALEDVGPGDRLFHMPSQLSGGQQQWVAIARATVNDPAFILADEPTGNRDTEMTLEVMSIFQELNQRGKTIVMVTHEPGLPAYPASDHHHARRLGVSDEPVHARRRAADDLAVWKGEARSPVRRAGSSPVRIGRLFTYSVRSIFRNRIRSLLTSLGIIIGVGSVIVMVAVGEGSQVQIAQQIASMGTNLIMVIPPRGPNQANRITCADVTKLRAETSYLAAISGEARQSFKVVGGSGYRSTAVMGVEPDYLTIKQWGVKSCEFFSGKDLTARSKVAVLGRTVVTRLFGDANPIGERIRIQTKSFTTIGVMASKGSTGMGEDQDGVVMVPLDTAITRLQKDRYLGAIEMSARRQDLMTVAQKEIEQIMRDSHRLSDSDTADFDVMNQSEIIKTASQTSKTLTTPLAAIAGVSLLVGGIGIMNIMLVSVTE